MPSSYFFPCHFLVLLCFPWDYPAIFPFFPPLELSGLASRVTTPLIVLAGWKMVCCSLSVGSLLLNAASGTPEHLDQSIGLSRPYFPHCPHPGDVCNNRREHTNPGVIGYRVRIQTPAASVLRMCVFWWGERGTGTASARALSGVSEGCVIDSCPLQVTSFCQEGLGAAKQREGC